MSLIIGFIDTCHPVPPEKFKQRLKFFDELSFRLFVQTQELDCCNTAEFFQFFFCHSSPE